MTADDEGRGFGGLDPHRDGELDGLAGIVVAADDLDELLAAEGGAALADLELRAGLVVQDPQTTEENGAQVQQVRKSRARAICK